MFPPDELHQEVHGNLVIHILAICNHFGEAFVDGTSSTTSTQSQNTATGFNDLVLKYPAFPGLRKFHRPPFYMLNSKNQGWIRKTTLSSADEMEAFLAISPPLLLLLYDFLSPSLPTLSHHLTLLSEMFHWTSFKDGVLT
jgi:hypothetical protein